MKKFKLFTLLLVAIGFGFTACDDDENTDPEFAEPTLTAPGVLALTVEETGTASFAFTAEAGFASASVTATGGTATITTDGVAEATTGAIEVSFEANNEVGAGSITLSVVDGDGETVSATAIVNKVAEGDAIPAISGIPTTATLTRGQVLTVNDVALTFADGFGSFTLSINDGTPIDLAATIDDVTGTSGTADITLETSERDPGNYVLVFSLVDENGTETTFTHVLTVEAPSFFVVEDIDDNDTPDDESDDILLSREITGSINADFTFTNDAVWILAGRVKVVRGAELTIEPGTVIKGREGAGGNATALLVTRGSTINAQGTAEAPIIMTSIRDEISVEDVESGDFTGSLAPTENGLWGGLIILGDAPISVANNTTAQIEGIPTSDADGIYGGDDADDNSGTVRYVSVRHGGSNIGSGNEINGITLGGVGSGTTIEWVEVVANQDDGIEWFGGTVNVSNALVWNSGDDAIDTDQAWNGTLDGFIVVTPTGSAFELDGPEGTFTQGNHILTNGTVYIGASSGNLIDFDENSNVDMSNIYFYGFTDGAKTVADYTLGSALNVSVDAFQYTLPGTITPAQVFVGIEAAKLTSAAANANTVGPTSDAGYEWTFASNSGALGTIGL